MLSNVSKFFLLNMVEPGQRAFSSAHKIVKGVTLNAGPEVCTRYKSILD